MMKNHIPKEHIDTIVQVLKNQLPGLMAVYGFGSRIHGCLHPDSDWDMAVLVPAYADPIALWNIASILEEKLSAPVDLLDFRAISTVMQYQILTTGQRWWALDGNTDMYEAMIFSEKMELDQARAGIIENIQNSGKIYG